MRYQHATEENDLLIAAAMDAMLLDAKAERAMDAPSVSSSIDFDDACTVGASPPPAPSVESGRRESNPRSQLGKLMFCR